MPIALVVGLALLAAIVVVRVSRPPLVVVATNAVAAEGPIAITEGNLRFCQGREALPRGSSAIRLGVSVNIGPKVQVTVLSGTRVIAGGAQAAGWTGEVVTVPIEPLRSAVLDATVCVALGPTVEHIELIGARGRRFGAGAPGEVRIEYLRPGKRSWWSLALPTARRMGLGRSPSGTWIALVPLVLMAAALVLTSWLIVRELGSRWIARLPAIAPIAGAQLAPERAADERPAQAGGYRPRKLRWVRGGQLRELGSVLRRVPAAAWACGAIACLSAASWSIVMPPFQVPDEPSHFAYVQQLAETGSLPTSGFTDFSPEEIVTLDDLDQRQVHFNALHGTISSPEQQRRLEHDLARGLPRRGGGGAGVAATQPPLYYALQTIPYYVGSGGNLLERLALMRLLSALMAGVTGLFAFLFLREALPGASWAWTVGGLGVALFPLLGFMSGAVNPDSMLCAVSAALFFCLARAFRRGLSSGLAVATGAVAAVGFLTKLNFLGLVPGLGLALVVLARRRARSDRRAAWRAAAATVAIAAVPVCVYALVNVLSGHAGLGLASTGIDLAGRHGSPLGEIGYIWQLYLPRLPGMSSDFPGLFTTKLWLDRSVGLYGWLDTTFPDWAYSAALIPVGALAGLCARALIASRTALRQRIWELLAYAAIAVGVLALVGADSYLLFPRRAGGYFEPRYLLPMAVLCGAVLALAARGAGRRWGPAVGALIVVLILGHDIFSQLLVVSRYYG